MEKERALELASQEGSHGIENSIRDDTVDGQKKSIKKGVKREHKSTSGFSGFQGQKKLGHDESARMSSSLDSTENKPEGLEIVFDVDKSRIMQPRQSISSVDSSTDSQSLEYLGKRVNSPESNSDLGPNPHCPVSVLAPYNDINSFTSSLLSESSTVTGSNNVQKMEDMESNRMIKTEYDSQFENCLHRNPSGSSSLTSPPILEGYHAQNGPPASIHSNKFFHANYSSDINTGFVRQEEMRTLDYETDLNEKLYPKHPQACISPYDSNSTGLAYGASSDSHCCISSSSSESTIWDKEILGKLQVNDNSFKMELKTSEIYAPVRNHYAYLGDVELGGMFNRLPLYIQTLQQLDVCQRTGLLLKLQEVPNDMINKICKMLAMEDRFAVSKEGVSMGKDSTFLIQGTLQRLKFSMDTLWKPIWLMRQYVRQGLSSVVNIKKKLFKLLKILTLI